MVAIGLRDATVSGICNGFMGESGQKRRADKGVADGVGRSTSIRSCSCNGGKRESEHVSGQGLTCRVSGRLLVDGSFRLQLEGFCTKAASTSRQFALAGLVASKRVYQEAVV